jgi:hypothetical protein
MKNWLFLAGAIVSEVIATSALKGKWTPTLSVRLAACLDTHQALFWTPTASERIFSATPSGFPWDTHRITAQIAE